MAEEEEAVMRKREAVQGSSLTRKAKVLCRLI